MHLIHTIPEPFFNGHLGTDMMLHWISLDDKEDSYAHEFVKTILRKRQIKLGMVSPFAWPFYLTTEKMMEMKMPLMKIKDFRSMQNKR